MIRRPPGPTRTDTLCPYTPLVRYGTAGRCALRYPSHSSYVHARQAMGGFSIWHWLIVLAVVLLIFGTKRLTSGAKDLGSAVKEFKKGMRDDDKPAGQLSDQSRQADDSASEDRKSTRLNSSH